METKQINLKIPTNLLEVASSYAKNYGFRNVQELAVSCMREKIFEDNEFDESFSDKDIALIDDLISSSLKKKNFKTEKELNKILLG